ncbi:MAG: VWA domain-containing protein, partial [Pseudomonadota bacterium]
RLSRETETPPTGTIGGQNVTFTGEGRTWRGEFNMAAALQGDVNGRTPIALRLTDESGRSLDGDPRSVTQINPPGSRTAWVRYEDKRGGTEAASGGTDDWHFLSAPVDLSLVLILDASGSMGEGTGRMEAAKAGIETTLSTLPEDKVVEIGGVIFRDCGSFQTQAFTRDIEGVRSFFQAASPTSGTPLAQAHNVAGNLFDASADPAAQEWRYATFTDGQESCGGDVATAARGLDQKIANRTAPEPEEDEPPALEEIEQVDCRPASWRAYEVESIAASPTDTIRLIEHWYLERSLPDGRCFARLETRQYGVYYGSSRSYSGWGINSRPSETDSIFGSSSRSVDDLNRVRRDASNTQRRSTSLADARAEIELRVTTQLERN